MDPGLILVPSARNLHDEGESMVGSPIRNRALRSLFVSRLLLPMLLLGVANTTPSAVGGTRTEPRKATGATFAYLVGCGGDYLRIDADQYEVISRGRVWDDPSTESIRPDSFARFDGCLVDSLRSDPKRGVVYLVVKEHGFDDPEGNNEYLVVCPADGKVPHAMTRVLDDNDSSSLQSFTRVGQYRGQSFDDVGRARIAETKNDNANLQGAGKGCDFSEIEVEGEDHRLSELAFVKIA